MTKLYHAVQMFPKITNNTYSIKLTGIQDHVEWAKQDHVDLVFQNLQWTKPMFLNHLHVKNEKIVRGKELWLNVKRLLNNYGLGTETTDTFQDMLEQLNISYDD